MASKFSVNRVNQIFPDNKLRSNQSEVDASLTSKAVKSALSKPIKNTSSNNSLGNMIKRAQ